MPITPERRAQIQQMLQQSSQPTATQSTSTITPERRAQIDALVKGAQVSPQVQTPPQATPTQPGAFQSFVQGIAKPFENVAATVAGIGEGAYNLAKGDVKGANEALSRERDFGYFGKARPLNIDEQGNQATPGQNLRNVVGTAAELGSYIAPVEGLAAKGGGLLSRVGEGAALGATSGALGSGGAALQDPNASVGSVLGSTVKGGLLGGVIGGALPLPGAAAESVTAPLKRYVSESLPGRLVNSVLKPLEKEFRFGRDPGMGVVEEGLTANTREGLARQITNRKEEIGQQIDSILNSAVASSKKIDIAPAISTLDTAIARATESGEPALVQRLSAIKQGLTDQFDRIGGGRIESKALNESERATLTRQLDKLKGERSRAAQGGARNSAVEAQISDLEEKLSPSYGKKPTELSPADAAALKRQIGADTKWTGQAFDNEANQARVAVYRAINDAIERAVPGTKKLNGRYANMLGAEKSLERTMSVGQRQNIVGLQETLGAGVGAGVGLTAGGIPAIISGLMTAGIVKGAKSTAFNTRLAQILSKMSPEEVSILTKAIPLLSQITRANINSGASKATRGSEVQAQ